MDKQLLSRLTHPVQYIPIIDIDKYGKAVEGDPIPLMAYRHGTRERVLDFEGVEFISDRQYIVDGIHEASEGDLLLAGNKKKPIKACANFDGLVPGTGTTIFYL